MLRTVSILSCQVGAGEAKTTRRKHFGVPFEKLPLAFFLCFFGDVLGVLLCLSRSLVGLLDKGLLFCLFRTARPYYASPYQLMNTNKRTKVLAWYVYEGWLRDAPYTLGWSRSHRSGASGLPCPAAVAA